MKFINPAKLVTWPLELRTRRLVLRPPTEADFETWRKAHLEALPARDKHDRGPTDPKEVSRRAWRRLLARQRRFARIDRWYVFGAFERRSGAYVGFVDLATISRGDWNSANLGYVFQNQFQGRGYATEAVRAVIRAAFSKLHYWRLEAACRVDNPRSIALAKRAGMTREGIRRLYWRDPDGWTDHVVFVALAPRETRIIRAIAERSPFGVPRAADE